MFKRLYNIDRLRTLAALGIIWFHSEGLPYRSVGYAGLPLFLLIFFMLIGMKGYEPTSFFCIKKFRRLIVPWLFWSVVYLCYQGAKYYAKHENPIAPYMYITGPSIHLWYLPYAWTLAVLVNIPQKYIKTQNEKYAIWAAAIMTLVLAGCISLAGKYYEAKPPLAQWLYGLTACSAGWLIGRVYEKHKDNHQTIVLIFCIVLAGLCLVMKLCGFGYLGVSYIVGFVVFGLAIYLPFQKRGFLARLAPYTFGIYLVHPLWGGMISFILPVLDDLPLLKFVLIVLMTVISSIIIKSIKPLSRFV